MAEMMTAIALKAVMTSMVQLLRARGSSLVKCVTDRVNTISEEDIMAVLDVSLMHVAALTPEQRCSARDEVLDECRKGLFPVLGVVNAVATFRRGLRMPPLLQESEAKCIVDRLWEFWSGAQPVDTSVLELCRPGTGFDHELALTDDLPSFLRAYTHAVIGTYLTIRRSFGLDLTCFHMDMAVLASVMYRDSAVVQDRIRDLCASNLSQIEDDFAGGIRSSMYRPRWTAMWAAYYCGRDAMSFNDVRMREALASGDLIFGSEYLYAAMAGRLFVDADDTSEDGCIWNLVEFEDVACEIVRAWLTGDKFPRLLARNDGEHASFAFVNSRKRVCLR